MRTRPILTIQRFYDSTRIPNYRGAMLRLRGHWLAEVFPPRTRVRVTREERRGKLVLVIEEIEKAEGGHER